eukprot:11330538-Alexandrium_andersonii.AAC.1
MQGSDGVITSEPSKLDQMLREAWQGVFQAAGENVPEQIATFMERYGEFVFEHDEVSMSRLTGEQLMRAAVNAGLTAPGVD